MTSKVNKKIIILGLEILAILAFGLIILPTTASAEYYGSNYIFGTTPGNDSYYYNPTPYQAPIYVAPTITPAPTPTIYSSSANPNASAAPKKTTVATAKPVNVDDNKLAANVLPAGNNFMPASIIQWLLFAILVLLIVILVRKIIGADKNYFATPLKHD